MTNNLGGANRIYQFSVDLSAENVIDLLAPPTGFYDYLAGWTDNNYSTAIAPGETADFSAFTYADYIPPSIGWSVSVESGPNGEAAAFFEGAVETIPEPSTWAMISRLRGARLCGLPRVAREGRRGDLAAQVPYPFASLKITSL